MQELAEDGPHEVRARPAAARPLAAPGRGKDKGRCGVRLSGECKRVVKEQKETGVPLLLSSATPASRCSHLWVENRGLVTTAGP